MTNVANIAVERNTDSSSVPISATG